MLTSLIGLRHGKRCSGEKLSKSSGGEDVVLLKVSRQLNLSRDQRRKLFIATINFDVKKKFWREVTLMPTFNMLNKNYYSHCPLKKRPIKKGKSLVDT